MVPPPWLLRAVLPILRSAAGYRGLSLGVCGLVRDDGGRILLVRHSYRDGWHFPGGGVKRGETAQQAVVRELAEETGVRVTGPVRLLGLFHNHRWRVGDHTVLFEAVEWEPGPSNSRGEIVEARFHDPKALPPGTSPSVAARLAELAGAPPAHLWDPNPPRNPR